MDDMEKALALLDLEDGAKCQLNHGPFEPDDAVGYLVEYLGKTDGIVIEQKDTLIIPICQECADALASGRWILLYCFTCNSSQWVDRELSKNKYAPGKKILWLQGCPECGAEKTDGLWFG